MNKTTLIPVAIVIDGRTVECETRVATFSPYVVALDTTLPEHGVELHSTYTGHPHTRTLASHLMLAPGLKETRSAEHDHDAVPVLHDRQRCLYDHLACLQDLFHRLGVRARIPLGEDALAAIER